ncbi:actin-crosslinking protein [Thozetella sp. PMI_491]|nr:actin-crosslinking protein [Thozetella sp. PMI_491]
MVKPLSFKGDKKTKKRRRPEAGEGATDDVEGRRLKIARAEEDPENDDSWVSADVVGDVSGPIMFVLPSEPPSALACDATGKVFTVPIENIIDDNPSTAEPHDVRQVWVANKIAGTDNFRFKSHHGKHLGCDKYGVFSATAEAVSPLESFNLISTTEPPGTFQVQTLRDTFLAVKPPTSAKSKGSEVRGDATDITFDTTVRIRMQARFKPKIRVSKEEKAREKVSRATLEAAVGRKLEDDEVKRLRRARREGDYHEVVLDMKVKSKHDKFG